MDFTRLIGHIFVDFYDRVWTRLGYRSRLQIKFTNMTGVKKGVLLEDYIPACGVAERMLWASRRRTTRVEDVAYCLLGLFDVNMPMLYGEGEKAFLRLQTEILKIHEFVTTSQSSECADLTP